MHLKPNVSHEDKTILTLIFISIVGYFSAYLFNLVLAHYLTPVRLGECNLAIRTLDILASLTLLGTNISSRRFLSRFLTRYDEQALQAYIKWNIQLLTASFIICLALAFTSYFVMHALHIWHIKDIKTYHMAIYMLWVAPLAALFLLLNSYLLCADYVIMSNLLQNLKIIFYILFFLIITLFAAPNFHALSVSSIFFMSFFVLVFIEFKFITRYTPALFNVIIQAVFYNQQVENPKDWLTVSLRMVMNNLLYLFLVTIDLILVQFISPNKASVGLYAVALTIVSAIMIIPKNIQGALKAHISVLLEGRQGHAQLQKKINLLNRYTLGIILLISGVILMFSNQLLSHFGHIYLQAEQTLVILTVAYMIAGFSQSATTLITYSGQEKLLLKISILEIIVLIVSGIIMTYLYDITGTAIATLLAMLFKACIFHTQAYRKVGIITFAI